MRSESKARFRNWEGVSVFSAEQLLAFLCRQPIPDTHSQLPDAFHTPNACREIRAKKSAIGRFIRQPEYRRQSQVNRRRGLWGLFECDPVLCDHGLVKREARLRAVPVDDSRMAWSYERFELANGRLFRTADFDCSRSGSLSIVFGTRLRLLFAIGSSLQCRGEKRDPVLDSLTSRALSVLIRRMNR